MSPGADESKSCPSSGKDAIPFADFAVINHYIDYGKPHNDSYFLFSGFHMLGIELIGKKRSFTSKLCFFLSRVQNVGIEQCQWKKNNII